MFESETVGPCLVQKLKCGGGGGHAHPLPPPGGYAPEVKIAEFYLTLIIA